MSPRKEETPAELPPFARNLIGHTQAQAQLANWFSSGRIPSALLLTGPEGIGKRVLAEHIASWLLCDGTTENETLAFSREHPVFHQLNAQSCPDYRLLSIPEGRASIGVEATRELLSKLTLSSVGNRRICVIDAADDLTPQAANVLLKTLEEPQPGLHFIVIAHSLARLLPTIISRCQTLKLQVLNDAETAQVIAEQLPSANAATQQALVELASGCPGQALALGEAGAQTWQQLQQHDYAALHSATPKQALPLLQRYVAWSARQSAPGEATRLSELYQSFNQEYAEALEYNLTLPWLLDKHIQQLQAVLSR